MKEGYYWIQHVGVVQVAYYTNDTVDDLETGKEETTFVTMAKQQFSWDHYDRLMRVCI